MCYCHPLSCFLRRSKAEPRPVVGAYLNLARPAANPQQQLCCKREPARCRRCCPSCWPAKAGLLDRKSGLDQGSNFAGSPWKRSYSNISATIAMKAVQPSASQTYSLSRLKYNKTHLADYFTKSIIRDLPGACVRGFSSDLRKLLFA